MKQDSCQVESVGVVSARFEGVRGFDGAYEFDGERRAAARVSILEFCGLQLWTLPVSFG